METGKQTAYITPKLLSQTELEDITKIELDDSLLPIRTADFSGTLTSITSKIVVLA